MGKHLKVLIDAKPKWRGKQNLDDYNARLIKGLTTYPLFVFSEVLGEYIYGASKCYFSTNGGKKHYIRIKDGIRDCKGNLITAEDYKKSILSQWMEADARFFLNKVLAIDTFDNWIIIKLKYADPCFYKVLSRTDSSPNKCGKYYITQQNDDNIVLSLNGFYNNKHNELPTTIEFEVDPIAQSNIQKVMDSIADLTSNMLFVNRYLQNATVKQSDVYIEIRFSSDAFKGNRKQKLRKRIAQIIKTIDLDKYGAFVSNKVQCNRHKSIGIWPYIDMPITIGCTNFYPNVELTDEIVKRLTECGFSAQKTVLDYYNKAECDLMVSLSYLPYHDVSAYYGSSILFSDFISVNQSPVLFAFYKLVYLLALKFPKQVFLYKILNKVVRYKTTNVFLGFIKSTYIKSNNLSYEVISELFDI